MAGCAIAPMRGRSVSWPSGAAAVTARAITARPAVATAMALFTGPFYNCRRRVHFRGGRMVRFLSFAFRRVAALGAADAGNWAGDLAPIAPGDWTYERAAHLAERAGFGATPHDIRRLAAMTPAAAVAALVDYDAIPSDL